MQTDLCMNKQAKTWQNECSLSILQANNQQKNWLCWQLRSHLIYVQELANNKNKENYLWTVQVMPIWGKGKKGLFQANMCDKSCDAVQKLLQL